MLHSPVVGERIDFVDRSSTLAAPMSRWESPRESVVETVRASRPFLPGAILNAGLIVAIVGFDWRLLDIAVLYVAEIAVINLVYLIVALFTPQPIEDLDEPRWNTAPTPLQPIPQIPPVYPRNARFILRYVVFVGVIVPIVLHRLVSAAGPESLHTTSVGIAIGGSVLFELVRVWRSFVRDRSYRAQSPMDALTFGLVPLTELLLLVMYVIVPVTIGLAVVGIGFGVEFDSRIALLIYLVPMGVIRVWISGLDPQTDDIEISVL